MNDLVDISPDHLKVVQEILRENLPSGVAVWAFGSRASWATSDSSDLDLALEGDIDHDTILALEMAFEESSLPYTVDIIDLNQVSDSFRRIVEAQKIPLTDVDKLGRSIDGWITIPLGEVCTKIGSGATPRGGREVYLKDGPYTLIRSQNVHNTGFTRDGLVFLNDEHVDGLGNAEVLPNDVLLNITGDSVARVCQVDTTTLPARVNQHVAIIRPIPNRLDAKFLRYYLSSPKAQATLLSWAGSGGTRNALTKQMIESFEVTTPADIRKQRTVAHILGVLDDKIELNRRMNQTLEGIARTLFKSWFVDFDPVRAKMDERWRSGELLPGLPAHLYDLFPNELVDSELGEMPKGWEVRPLDVFANVIYGSPFNSKLFNKSGKGFPLIRIRDLTKQNPLVFTDEQNPRNHLIKPTDIVVGMDGEFRAHIWMGPVALLNQRVCHFIPKIGIPRMFLFASLIKPLFIFEQSKVGTTVIHLSKTDIDSIMISLPTTDILTEFGYISDMLIEQIAIKSLESRILASQRGVLLPKLMSGEFRMEQKTE